jgi:hypothetical protein
MPKNQSEMSGEGFDRPVIKAIESAAEEYITARNKFQRASEACQTAKTNLVMAMDKNKEKLPVDGEGNSVYRYDDELVVLSESLGVKVKTVKSEDEKH